MPLRPRPVAVLWPMGPGALTGQQSTGPSSHPPPGCLCAAVRSVPALALVAHFSRRAGPAFHRTGGLCQRVRWRAVVFWPLPPMPAPSEETPPLPSPLHDRPFPWLLS